MSQRRVSRPIEWVLVGLVGLTLLGVLAAMLLLFGERDYLDRVYPNVSVRGQNLGNLRGIQARGALEQRYAAFLANPVELVYAGQVWRPDAADLGVTLDIDGAVRAALAVGREETRLNSARTVAETWQQGVEMPLRVIIDQEVMQRYLVGLAREVERAPHDADLHLDGAAIVVTPEESGVQVLIDETLYEITAALYDLEPRQVTVRTRALTPRLRDADVAPVVEEARVLLDGPIVLAGDDQQWQWSPEQIAAWVRVRRITATDGKPMIGLSIEQNAVRSALMEIAAAVRRDGDLPRVDWNGGDLQLSEPGTPGQGLDAALALAQVNAALRGGSRVIDLPLIELPPPVTEANLAALNIVAPVAAGESSFRGSEAYRITNIRAGSRRMHGRLIPPGATFSFNDTLGVVDAAGGFVEGYAIVDNRTQKEWGGGLCQVSTTVFRAAFWAGLPIAERHEHSFRIIWYEDLGEPPGLDATIFTGVSDLQFVNDTGGWLLLQSAVDLQRQRLTIALYGQPTQRTVTMDHQILERTPPPNEPLYVDDPTLPAGAFKQTDVARGGMKIEVYREVREDSRLVRRDTFPTTFLPWPDIYVRGTGGR